jgi:hypothetical protein
MAPSLHSDSSGVGGVGGIGGSSSQLGTTRGMCMPKTPCCNTMRRLALASHVVLVRVHTFFGSQQLKLTLICLLYDLTVRKDHDSSDHDSSALVIFDFIPNISITAVSSTVQYL